MCKIKRNKPSDKPHTEKCIKIRKTTENEEVSEGNKPARCRVAAVHNSAYRGQHCIINTTRAFKSKSTVVMEISELTLLIFIILQKRSPALHFLIFN